MAVVIATVVGALAVLFLFMWVSHKFEKQFDHIMDTWWGPLIVLIGVSTLSLFGGLCAGVLMVQFTGGN